MNNQRVSRKFCFGPYRFYRYWACMDIDADGWIVVTQSVHFDMINNHAFIKAYSDPHLFIISKQTDPVTAIEPSHLYIFSMSMSQSKIFWY